MKRTALILVLLGVVAYLTLAQDKECRTWKTQLVEIEQQMEKLNRNYQRSIEQCEEQLVMKNCS